MDFFLEALSTPAPLLLPLRRLSGCRSWGIVVVPVTQSPQLLQLCLQVSMSRTGRLPAVTQWDSDHMLQRVCMTTPQQTNINIRRKWLSWPPVLHDPLTNLHQWV
jgi:hypothetical protein